MPSFGDSPRSPRPRDLHGVRMDSRREDHGQVSIIKDVLFDDSELHTVLDTMVVNSPKQVQFYLFLDTALKTVACQHASTGSQDLASQKLAILDRTCPRKVWPLPRNGVMSSRRE